MTAQHAMHRADFDASCADCLRLYGDPIQFTDEEPAYRCGVCGVNLGPRYEHPCAGPTRWGWAPVVIVVLLALAALAWRLTDG